MRFLTTLALWLPVLAFATPGAVDKYDCHRDFQTNEYHCHGSEDASKQHHVLLGVVLNSDVWTYDDGPFNAFLGASGRVEVARSFFGIYGSWAKQSHITGATNYSIYGWDTGLKLGPSISRVGLHPFVDVGYYALNYELPTGDLYPFQGLQYGAGLAFNQPNLAMDVKLLNRDAAGLKNIWVELGEPGLTYNVSVQLGAYLRF
jgi:hypothetical protein